MSNAAQNLTVTFNGPPANVAPIAENKTVSTNEDAGVVVALTATDPNQCDLTFSIVAGPTNGIVGSISYEGLMLHFDQNPNVGKRIIEKCLMAARARDFRQVIEAAPAAPLTGV